MKTFVLLISLLTASASTLSETRYDLFSYQSKNRQSRGGEDINLKAELRIPSKGEPPFKTIILVHSSGPDVPLKTFSGRTDKIAIEVGNHGLAQGYAVVFLDSFTPREISEANRNGQVQIGAVDMARDVFFLIRELQKDKRFDKENLFLFGHSMGGGTAREVSYANMWAKSTLLNNNATPFRAVASSAPACNIQPEGSPAQPLKIFIGILDDWTPPQPCVTFIERQRKLGVDNVEIELIPKVGHSYSTSGTAWRSDVQSFRGCLDNIVTKSRQGKLIQEGKEISEADYRKTCVTQGATSRGGGEKVPELAEKVISYFNKF